MLVGKQTQMPPPSRHQGRMQVYVKGGGLTEVQVAFFTHEQARQLAEEGTGPRTREAAAPDRVPPVRRRPTRAPHIPCPAAAVTVPRSP